MTGTEGESSQPASRKEAAVTNKGKQPAHGTQLTKSPTSKRTRSSYIGHDISNTLFEEMQQLRSDGQYSSMESKVIHIFGFWKDYQVYNFVNTTPSEKAYLNGLLDHITQPRTIIQTLKLLVVVSNHKQQATMIEPPVNTLVPSLTPDEVLTAGTDHLPLLVQAAKRAQAYLVNFPLAPYEARLRHIMAAITLFFTLEYGFAVRLRTLNPEWNSRTIKTEKWKAFVAEMRTDDGKEFDLGKLEESVKVGKMLWRWAQNCGIMWLPFFASMDRGLTAFRKKNPKKHKRAEVIGSQLATKDSWIAISKAFSGIVLNLLFGSTSPEYTLQQLFRLYISEPNGTESAAAFKKALGEEKYDTNLFAFEMDRPLPLQLEDATVNTLFDIVFIGLSELPSSLIGLKNCTKINLIEWVLTAEQDSVIQLNTFPGQDLAPLCIHVRDLACLFSSTNILESVFSFLVDLWDSGAINGWCCLSLEEGRTFLGIRNSIPISKAMGIATGANVDLNSIRFLLIPIEATESYFLYACSIEQKEIRVFYLESFSDMEKAVTAILKVSSKLIWKGVHADIWNRS